MPIKYSWNTSLSNQENCKCKCALHYCLPCNQLMVQSNFAKCLQICLHLCPWYWNLRMANCSFLAGPGFFLPLPVIVLASGTALGIRGKLSMFILNTGLYPIPARDYCLQRGLHRGRGLIIYNYLRYFLANLHVCREGYIEAMAEHVNIHIYGTCGAPCPGATHQECLQYLARSAEHRSYSRDPGDSAGY